MDETNVIRRAASKAATAYEPIGMVLSIPGEFCSMIRCHLQGAKPSLRN